MRHTPCQTEDPEQWFSDRPAEIADAQVKCMANCPMQEACLERAIANDEQFGVWGGADFKRRRGPQTGVLTPKQCLTCGAWMVPSAPIARFRARQFCNLSCANTRRDRRAVA